MRSAKLAAVAFVLASASLPAGSANGVVPVYPVVIRTDKDAYKGKDHIAVTLVNRNQEDVWLAPALPVERSKGDGTWAPVYQLQVTAACPEEPPEKAPCVLLRAGQDLVLVPWDWNTGGTDQCPPRRPGTRAFKGVHRITARFCEGKAPPNGEARVKLVTWE